MSDIRPARRPLAARALAALAAGVLGAAGVAALPAQADEEFVVGSGRADARIIRVGPSAGKLAIAPTIGLSLADFLGTLGRGEARTADLGALEVALPPEVVGLLPTSRTESTEENAEAGETVMVAGTPAGTPVTLGAIEEKTSATKAPRGASQVTVGAIGIPGVLEIGAAKASSTAQVIDKKTREARGVTSIGSLSLGGGAVVLRGLTWEAVQRTGEGAGTDGDFRVDAVTIAGQNVTVPAGAIPLDAVLPQINAALAPSGLMIDAPTVQKEGDFVRVTPLAIRVVNSQLGQTVVAPILGAIQPARDPVTGAIVENCAECAVAILLADVVAGVVSGGGRLDIELGGVTGYTEGTRYESPFDFDFSGVGGGASSDFGDDAAAESFARSDSGSSPSSFESSRAPLAPGASPGAGAGGLATPAGAPGDGAGAGADTNVAAGTLASASGDESGSTGGAAALIGLAGVLAALALGAADFRAIRAARRTIPGA